MTMDTYSQHTFVLGGTQFQLQSKVVSTLYIQEGLSILIQLFKTEQDFLDMPYIPGRNKSSKICKYYW